jgi:ATP-dependent Clp protease, protease subunit
MEAPVRDRPSPARLLAPDIRLIGEINAELYDHFYEGLRKAQDRHNPTPAEIVVELTTLGGDADLGRRIAGDIRAAATHLRHSFWFVGRTAVYSAGVTIMSAFPKPRRILSSDAVLLVHERKLDQALKLECGLAECLVKLEQLKAQVQLGIKLERDGFAALVEEADIDVEEVSKRARANWYVNAEDALDLGLIGGILSEA